MTPPREWFPAYGSERNERTARETRDHVGTSNSFVSLFLRVIPRFLRVFVGPSMPVTDAARPLPRFARLSP